MRLKSKLYLKLIDNIEEELIDWFVNQFMCPKEIGYENGDCVDSEELDCRDCWKLCIEKEK